MKCCGRVRMVDTLARTGERKVMIAPGAEIPVLDAPLDRLVAEPVASTRVPAVPLALFVGATVLSLN
jgi:hypothetical protein